MNKRQFGEIGNSIVKEGSVLKELSTLIEEQDAVMKTDAQKKSILLTKNYIRNVI